MNPPSLGEFEELVLLTVAAQHDQAYGVSIKDALEEHLGKPVNISRLAEEMKTEGAAGSISR